MRDLGFMRIVCKLGLALVTLPLLMGAKYYTWVDEDGQFHAAQVKPDGVEATLVDTTSGRRVPAGNDEPPASQPATGGDDASNADLNPRQQEMLERLKAAEAARQEEVARLKEENCRQARAVYERLTARGRIRIRGDDGQERMMPEEERQRRIEEAQRGIAANCSDTASR